MLAAGLRACLPLLLLAGGCAGSPAPGSQDSGGSTPDTDGGQADDGGTDGGTGDGDGGGDDDGGTDGDGGADTGQAPSSLVLINEFMASNTQLLDPAGGTADWIELYNPGDSDLPLAGWTITDDLDQPDKADLDDSLVVPAGGFLLLWADGNPDAGPAHLPFQLDREGESLGIFDAAGHAHDRLDFPQQATDLSAARAADGDPAWVLTTTATPGASNGALPVEDAAAAPDGDCQLAGSADPTWPWEGDSVAFTVACSGDLDTADARITAERLPDGATYDQDTHTLSWSTGPTDGGRADLVFSTRPRGAVQKIPAAATLPLWVADNPDLPSAVAPDPTTYTEEWGLPVLHLDPIRSLTQTYIPALVTWQGRTLSANAKIRGASSASYDKPSYTLEFELDEPVLPGFGGDSRDHLVLLTTFDDNSYVRQKLVYDLWAAIAAFHGADRLTPRTFFVVVYLDGAYHGLYVALDRIDNEFVRQMGFDDSGNLYKAVNHDANFALTDYYGSSKDTLHDGYTKEEGDPETDFSDLDDLVAFTGGSPPAALVAGADAWFDLDEFMDWLLLVHYSLAQDSAGKNAYLYHEPVSDRFLYVPWDFNHSWGQSWYTSRIAASSIDDYAWANRVFTAIQAVDATDTALWERFATMREPGGPFDPDQLTGRVDAYYDDIAPSAARDWERWESAYRAYGGWRNARNNARDWTDFEGEQAYLYQWLDDRAALYRERVP